MRSYWNFCLKPKWIFCVAKTDYSATFHQFFFQIKENCRINLVEYALGLFSQNLICQYCILCSQGRSLLQPHLPTACMLTQLERCGRLSCREKSVLINCMEIVI
uniref:Uncharacterized protein n=1 Tax=Anguilla anguilla TaxID=7936 RepID=A0A0E9X6G8_ANGAN